VDLGNFYIFDAHQTIIVCIGKKLVHFRKRSELLDAMNEVNITFLGMEKFPIGVMTFGDKNIVSSIIFGSQIFKEDITHFSPYFEAGLPQSLGNPARAAGGLTCLPQVCHQHLPSQARGFFVLVRDLREPEKTYLKTF
jgi:hypothetical protein